MIDTLLNGLDWFLTSIIGYILIGSIFIWIIYQTIKEKFKDVRE